MPVSPAERCARAVLTLFPRDSALHAGGAEAGVRDLRTRLDIDPDDLLAAHTAAGWRLLCPGDDEWPTALTRSGLAPVALWARGNGHLTSLTARSVAVTGTRAPSPHGARHTGLLAHGVVTATPPVTVMATAGSGVGVQALAAAAPDGPTVAVLAPTSLSRHPGLLEMVMAHGVLLSDAPPLGPSAHDAPQRRLAMRTALLAALASALLVVEAEQTGSVMEAARVAHRQGRMVMAVPPEDHADLSRYSGCGQLLRGAVAIPVTTATAITSHLPAA